MRPRSMPAPRPSRVGEKLDAEEIAADLRRAGYTEEGKKRRFADRPLPLRREAAFR